MKIKYKAKLRGKIDFDGDDKNIWEIEVKVYEVEDKESPNE